MAVVVLICGCVTVLQGDADVCAAWCRAGMLSAGRILSTVSGAYRPPVDSAQFYVSLVLCWWLSAATAVVSILFPYMTFVMWIRQTEHVWVTGVNSLSLLIFVITGLSLALLAEQRPTMLLRRRNWLHIQRRKSSKVAVDVFLDWILYCHINVINISNLFSLQYIPVFFCITGLESVPSVLWRCWLGGRKGIRPVKNWVVGCWHGYLSGARCRLAYGPADATATHCLLLQ